MTQQISAHLIQEKITHKQPILMKAFTFYISHQTKKMLNRSSQNFPTFSAWNRECWIENMPTATCMYTGMRR